MCTRHNILHCKAVSPSSQGSTALALFGVGDIHSADRPATVNSGQSEEIFAIKTFPRIAFHSLFNKGFPSCLLELLVFPGVLNKSPFLASSGVEPYFSKTIA